MEISANGGESVEKNKKKGERERKKKENKKEDRASSPDLRRSDGQNSSDQEVKSVFSTMATL